MKRLILILSLVAIANFAGYSQKLWEKVLSDSRYNHSEYKSSVLVNDTILVFSGLYNWMGCGSPLLYALNMEGDSLWMLQFDWGDLVGHTSFVESDGNFLYTSGATLMGDVISGDEPLFIKKIDFSGELIAETRYYDPEVNSAQFFPTGMDLLPGQFILVYAADYPSKRIAKFDLDGNMIWDKIMGFSFDQAFFAPNGNIIIRSESAIHIADPDGETISEIPLENPLINMLVLDTSVLAITDTVAWEIDLEQPVIVKNIQNPPVEGATFISAKVVNDQIWLLSSDHENAYVENISAEISEVYTLPLPAYSVQDFEISPDKIILSGSYSPWLVGVLAYGREQANPLVVWPDVELTDFEISNIQVFYLGGDNPIPPGIITHYKFDTEVEITNYTNEILNSFTLYSPRWSGLFCWAPSFFRNISNTEIDYQQPTSLEVGNSVFNLNNSETQISVCYQLIAPNGRMERNLDNNSICKDYDFTNVETVAEANEWKIFPNPVQNQLTIQSPGQVSFQYKLYGVDGRIVSEDFVNQGLQTINVSSFPAGLYLLVTEFDNQRFIHKILKQ
jgi:hypothetical protein